MSSDKKGTTPVNSKGITIKVTTSKVIALLEDKLKSMEQSLTDYTILEADYKSKQKTWETKCVSIATKQSSKALESNAVVSWSSGISNTTIKVTMYFDPALFPPKPEEPEIVRRGKVNMYFDPALFPPKPEEPEIVRRGKYSLEGEVSELRDTVRMLKLHE
ncbi:hypothetical protein, partial [Thiocapsa sp. N5-Cardenillas]|uniref:hypothetical protein n=1 Tax=Thiocapsa sp. N5-Cardenillas TaxID=3137397 RepID=UPI0035B39493